MGYSAALVGSIHEGTTAEGAPMPVTSKPTKAAAYDDLVDRQVPHPGPRVDLGQRRLMGGMTA